MSAPKLTQIGPYKVTRLIAEGGMAWVFEVVDPKFGVKRALKMLKPEAAAGEEFRRFQAEAQLLVELDHPNLITIFDSDRDEATGYHYYTMSYIDGKSLAELLPISFEQVGPMFLQVLAGLARLHKAGIIHRDIKPANVMLTSDDRVLLCDLGIARVANDDKGLTRVGTAIGTFRYMSPEQAQGKVTDVTCDIFAMGLTLYEVLIGSSFYDSLDLSDYGTAILFFLGQQVAAEKELEFKFPDTVDPQVQEIIRKACSLKPEDRYADAAAMHAAWAELLDSQASKTVALAAPTVAIQVPQMPRKRGLGVWLGVAAAAAMLAGAAFVFGPTIAERSSEPARDSSELPASELAQRELPPPTIPVPEVVEETPEPDPPVPEQEAARPAPPFERVMQLLLDRPSPWKQPRPRIRATPEMVKLGQDYSLNLQAECDCWSLLFALDEVEREVWLLYPNRYQAATPHRPGERLQIPPEGGVPFNADDVERTDTLVMIVLPDPIPEPNPFPADAMTGMWNATAEHPEHFLELEKFLQGLEGQRWARGITYLEITAE